MSEDEAIEWLEIIKDGFYYKDLESAITIEGYEDCEKAIETIINEYNNLKQIEEAHRIENGKLRAKISELEREINGLKQTFTIHDDIDSENAKDVIAKIMGADIVHLK